MNARALSILEFDKVRERLAERTSFAAGRELALDLTPLSSRRLVETGLQETSEAKLLLELQPEFSVRSVHDVRQAAENARIGAVLDPEVLLDVQDTLESAAYVRGAVTKLAERLPLLAGRVDTIDPCPIVSRAIKESIGERGQVLDSASPDLGRIRSQLRTAYNRLMDALQRILDAASSRGLAQEPIITTRAGRYVIPIRAEARGQFRGIVHDESASGATAFMEPLAAVELNNEWRHLQIEEEKEVERVLRHLSALVGQVADRIVANVNSVATIDLALAKAKYAYAIRAAAPALEPDFRLSLIQARHPLLTGNVVPIDVSLGRRSESGAGAAELAPGEPRATRDKEFTALVITGPNTGGKTVALKTVGLLQLMAQAGMHIPAEPESSVPVFEEVFADIGDEQSIEQSLSTFSSHMSNIVRILAEANERSLVLLDELGAGTDPQEGSALARAILSHLVTRGILTIATTHYSELKAYAYHEPGVQNASVEFDLESLRPTYRLMIGIPGRSNALAIAQRLGLPNAILDSARGLVAPSETQIEDLLGAIQAERDAARDVRLEAESSLRAAEAQRITVERRLDEIDDERAAILQGAQREAENVLEDARQRVRRAEQQVMAAGGDRLAVLRTAKEMQEAAHEVGQRHIQRRRRAPLPQAEDRPIGAGDRVELRRLNAVGQVVGEPNERGEVEVQLGNLRTRAHLRDLTRITRKEAEERGPAPERAPTYSRQLQERPVQLPAPPSSVRMELDVRGTRADDVLPRVEQYLSDAYMSSMPFVRIIHGKGTGVLRQIIRESLGSNPLVQSYETASQHDGGEGATIVKLAV